MNVQQTYIKTLTELTNAKVELIKRESESTLRKKVKLKEKEKIYRKLSDIEIQLGKIECHSNELLKLTRLQTKLIYHQLKIGNKQGHHYVDSALKEWWNEFSRISD